MTALEFRYIMSMLSSMKGFPISSIVVTSDHTSWTNFSWTLLVCSWRRSGWVTDVRGNPIFVEAVLKLINLSRYLGPATIHLQSSPEFSVRPTAPPLPLTSALICSCAWSNGRESVVCLLGSECSAFELTKNILTSLLQGWHISHMNR